MFRQKGLTSFARLKLGDTGNTNDHGQTRKYS